MQKKKKQQQPRLSHHTTNINSTPLILNLDSIPNSMS